MTVASQPRCALITGAAKRIGAVIATHLHQVGFNVVIHYRHSSNEAKQLCQLLNRQRAQSAKAIQADLQQVDAIHQLVDATHHCWGRIDALVNNASSFSPTPMGEISETAWHDLLGSNVKAPLFLAQACQAQLKQHHGSIVNIADIHGIHPLRDYSVYSLAKAALIMLTKSLALEMAPDIRVNAIAPGATLWPEGENALPPQQKQHILDKTALKKLGSPEAIAQATHYLIDQATHTTGHVLNVDGGRYL